LVKRKRKFQHLLLEKIIVEELIIFSIIAILGIKRILTQEEIDLIEIIFLMPIGWVRFPIQFLFQSLF
jgi:hypothetical protein